MKCPFLPLLFLSVFLNLFGSPEASYSTPEEEWRVQVLRAAIRAAEKDNSACFHSSREMKFSGGFRYYLEREILKTALPDDPKSQAILEGQAPDLWTRCLAKIHKNQYGFVLWEDLLPAHQQQMINQATSDMQRYFSKTNDWQEGIQAAMKAFKHISAHARTLAVIFQNPMSRMTEPETRSVQLFKIRKSIYKELNITNEDQLRAALSQVAFMIFDRLWGASLNLESKIKRHANARGINEEQCRNSLLETYVKTGNLPAWAIEEDAPLSSSSSSSSSPPPQMQPLNVITHRGTHPGTSQRNEDQRQTYIQEFLRLRQLLLKVKGQISAKGPKKQRLSLASKSKALRAAKRLNMSTTQHANASTASSSHALLRRR